MSGALWGKAGVRLTSEESAQRFRRRRAELMLRADQADAARQRSDAVAYEQWRTGHVKPYMITRCLDVRDLYGPGVDQACGVEEPAVDRWEAGELYPNWEQLRALAALCVVTPEFLCADNEKSEIAGSISSARFHFEDWNGEVTVWGYPDDVWRPVVAAYENFA